MLSANVIRKKRMNPENLQREKRLWLEEATRVVQETAKRLCPTSPGGGRLKNSITKDVKPNLGEVGTNVEYAPYVEYGTRPHYIGSSVLISGVGWRYIGMHPGTKAQPYLRPAIDMNREALTELWRTHVRTALRGK